MTETNENFKLEKLLYAESEIAFNKYEMMTLLNILAVLYVARKRLAKLATDTIDPKYNKGIIKICAKQKPAQIQAQRRFNAYERKSHGGILNIGEAEASKLIHYALKAEKDIGAIMRRISKLSRPDVAIPILVAKSVSKSIFYTHKERIEIRKNILSDIAEIRKYIEAITKNIVSDIEAKECNILMRMYKTEAIKALKRETCLSFDKIALDAPIKLQNGAIEELRSLSYAKDEDFDLLKLNSSILKFIKQSGYEGAEHLLDGVSTLLQLNAVMINYSAD